MRAGTLQKVFIFGADVSSYVYATSASLDDSPSPSSFQIDLVDQFNTFTLTPEDLELLFAPELDALVPEPGAPDFPALKGEARRDAVLADVLERISTSVNMPALKREVLTAKILAPALRLADLGNQQNIGIQNFREYVRQQARTNPTVGSSLLFAGIDTSDNASGVDDVILRYDFRAFSPIFHGSDAVTIFELCPTTGDWHVVASGTPVGFTRTETDPGRATMRLSCQDNARTLNEGLVSFNPALTDVGWIATNQTQVTQTFFTDGLHNVPFYAAPYAVIFGTAALAIQSSIAGNDTRGIGAVSPNGSQIGFSRQEQRPVQFFASVNGYSKVPLDEQAERASGFYSFDDSRLLFFDPDAKGGDGASSGSTSTEASLDKVRRNVKFGRLGDLCRRVTSLGEYQLLCDSRVLLSDLRQKAIRGGQVFFRGVAQERLSGGDATTSIAGTNNVTVTDKFLQQRATRCMRLRKVATSGESPTYVAVLDTEALVRELGTNPHIYPPQTGRVLTLLPIAFASDSDVTNFSLHGGPGMSTDFKSRLTILSGLAERVESSVHVTPKGDVLVEFPLYDFRPHDYLFNPDSPFVREWVRAQRDLVDESALRRQIGQTTAQIDFSVFEPRPREFFDRYMLAEDSYHGHSVTLNGAQIVSQVQTSYYTSPSPETGFGLEFGAKPQVVSSPTLIAQYGLKLQQEDPKGTFVGTPEAAQAFAALAFNRLNAEVETGNLPEIYPRLGLNPNRVIVFARGYACARIKSISLARQVGTSYNLSFGFNNYRAWNGMYVTVRDPTLPKNVETTEVTQVPMLVGLGSELGRPIDWRNFMSGRSNLVGYNPPGSLGNAERRSKYSKYGSAFDSAAINERALVDWFNTRFAPYVARQPGANNGHVPRITSSYRPPKPGTRFSAHNIGLALDFCPATAVVPRGPGGVSRALANSPGMLQLFELAQSAGSIPELQRPIGIEVGGRSVAVRVTPSFVLLHTVTDDGTTGWHIHFEARVTEVTPGS